MSDASPNTLLAQLRRTASTGSAVGALPDAELLRRFVDSRDEAAFEVLVWRHGPMVWTACRRILGHCQDAEDVFQAAFLALAKTVGRTAPRQSVGGWLHRVSVNAALKLRASRRPASELPPNLAGQTEEPERRELARVVDEELDRLPDHYRSAFVLCCLEGMTNAAAARELGCPVGTVDSRIHAARTRLQKRLYRRGIGVAELTGLSVIAVPEALSAAAISFGMGAAAPPAVTRLANNLGMNMLVRTAAFSITAVLAAALSVAAVWAFALPPKDSTPPAGTMVAPSPHPVTVVPEHILLFTELVFKPGEDSSRTLRLVRATFRDGKLIDREELHTGDASEFGYQNRYHLIDNRYVVFEYGTVVDLAEKKVLHPLDHGYVLAVERAKVYYFRGDGADDEGVFLYDPITGKREKVAKMGEGRWGLRGALSPDGSKAIVREPKNRSRDNESLYVMFLERVGKPLESFGEFAATYGLTGGTLVLSPKPPGVWLDNDRFVTQTTLGKLVVLNVADKSQTKLVDIPLTHKPGEKTWETIGVMGFTPLGLQQPRFSLLPDGRLVYEADVVYFINVAKKTWEKPLWRPLGYGFDYSAAPDKIVDVDRYSKIVSVSLRHRGKVIGESDGVWWTTPAKPRAVATDGHLAVIERVSRPGVQVSTDAVRVWTAEAGWVLLDGWADSVIGWVK